MYCAGFPLGTQISTTRYYHIQWVRASTLQKELRKEDAEAALNFSISWCPCPRHIMPSLQGAQKQVQGEGAGRDRSRTSSHRPALRSRSPKLPPGQGCFEALKARWLQGPCPRSTVRKNLEKSRLDCSEGQQCSRQKLPQSKL